MIIGVPLFATVLELLKIRIGKRLAEKGLPDETESYYAPDAYAGTPESAHGTRPRRQSRAAEAADSSGVTTGAGRLSPTERMNLGTLSLAMRHGLFRNQSDEALEAFAADEAQFLAKITAATQAEEKSDPQAGTTAPTENAAASGTETETEPKTVAETATETVAEEEPAAVPDTDGTAETVDATAPAESAPGSDRPEGGADI